MARYDAGWRRFPGGSSYDEPFGFHGRPGGFRPERRRYDAGFGEGGWGGGDRGGTQPWGDVGAGGMGERETFWEPGTIYGPARYGLGPYHERLRRQRRTDDELKDEVAEALFYDTWVDADAIAVEVSDGIVTLRGELPDYDEIRYATDDAWDVEGVRGVRSELSIRESGESAGPRVAEPRTVEPQAAAPGGGKGGAAKRTRKGAAAS